jgi:hypothetical protein
MSGLSAVAYIRAVYGRPPSQEVADELDVTLGTLAVTERELARALNLTRYARRLPAARGRSE